jgi:hypothetical protein
MEQLVEEFPRSQIDCPDGDVECVVKKHDIIQRISPQRESQKLIVTTRAWIKAPGKSLRNGGVGHLGHHSSRVEQ